jgi:formylglycine-generating enzyme required for sulfatase activity
MNNEMEMLDKLTNYAWMTLLVLIAYPYNTAFAQSDTPTAGQIWKEPVTGMEFVWVPEGCYEMGCGSWTSDCYRDEKPVHEVCVDGFWMGKTEVTQGQWKQIMGDNPAKFQKGDNYPFENAVWGEIEKFIMKLSSLSTDDYKFRVPTEAEWEYACRSGGKPEKYAGGSDLDQVAWYSGNSNRSTHAVATKAPNGLGLFDMNGNVNEWCADNPLFRAETAYGRIYRGGSWNSNPKSARCSARNMEIVMGSPIQEAPYRGNDLGVRLVRDK